MTARSSKTGRAFETVGLMNRTPLRLATSGGDDQGFSVEAGRSRRRGADGKVRVLLSNYEIPAADQGPLPFPNNEFAIPGVATFTLLDRRTVTYTNNSGYDPNRQTPSRQRSVSRGQPLPRRRQP
jgi:hypothetical protein